MPDNVPAMSKPKKRIRKQTSAAMLLGRRGGLQRAKNCTPEQLSEIGRNAAAARWGHRKPATAEQ